YSIPVRTSPMRPRKRMCISIQSKAEKAHSEPSLAFKRCSGRRVEHNVDELPEPPLAALEEPKSPPERRQAMRAGHCPVVPGVKAERPASPRVIEGEGELGCWHGIWRADAGIDPGIAQVGTSEVSALELGGDTRLNGPFYGIEEKSEANKLSSPQIR